MRKTNDSNMGRGIMNHFIDSLKNTVKNHPVLQSEWLEKRKDQFPLEDLKLWLCQEYFVSIGFVDWFLIVASQTSDQNAKIILVQNIWEELGEGDIQNTHVSILIQFLNQLGIEPSRLVCLPETERYLKSMKSIIETSFFHGLGALGPANEYLLKLEYKTVSDAYSKLKEIENLPEGSFFQVNLDADEGHSKRMFDLIQNMSDTPKKQEMVAEGNSMALDARKLFYEGLTRIETSIFR